MAAVAGDVVDGDVMGELQGRAGSRANSDGASTLSFECEWGIHQGGDEGLVVLMAGRWRRSW